MSDETEEPAEAPQPSALSPQQAPAVAVAPALTSADRERAIEQLSRHFADDGIELDEFERRATEVYRATTRAELQQLLHDVPAVMAANAAADMALNTDVPARERIGVVLSSTERHGAIKVARHLDIRTFMGNLEMDFTQATFAPGVTEIDIRVLMGNVELVFPEHVRVEFRGSSFMASVENLNGESAALANATSVVRVTGRAVMSSISLMNATAVRAVLTP